MANTIKIEIDATNLSNEQIRQIQRQANGLAEAERLKGITSRFWAYRRFESSLDDENDLHFLIIMSQLPITGSSKVSALKIIKHTSGYLCVESDSYDLSGIIREYDPIERDAPIKALAEIFSEAGDLYQAMIWDGVTI